MIRTRPFSSNPMLGTTTLWHYDDVTDEITLETTQDSEPLLVANYEERKDKVGVMTKMGDGNHLVAQLPMHLLYQLKAQGHWEPEDPKGVRLLKWLAANPNWRVDAIQNRYV